MAKKKSKTPTTGPRGGTTTVSASGQSRKTIWLNNDEAEALRRASFERRESESEIVRTALRRYLRITD